MQHFPAQYSGSLTEDGGQSASSKICEGTVFLVEPKAVWSCDVPKNDQNAHINIDKENIPKRNSIKEFETKKLEKSGYHD